MTCPYCAVGRGHAHYGPAPAIVWLPDDAAVAVLRLVSGLVTPAVVAHEVHNVNAAALLGHIYRIQTLAALN